MDLITWSDEFRTKLAEALGIQASEIRNHTTLEYFDVIVTIIWMINRYVLYVSIVALVIDRLIVKHHEYI